MLFNSYIFIFLFLPVTLLIFYSIGGRGHHRVAIAWLVGASLCFYGWWNSAYLCLIVASILFNYTMGVSLSRGSDLPTAKKKLLLSFGVATNIALLGYFKYANFFIENVNITFDTSFQLAPIVLPLAISFFTFQQIAYLVDAYLGKTRENNFVHYCLFVTFFPQLIAGPIVHHREMLPQFAKDSIYRINHNRLAVGVTIFFLGLFKKVILADGISIYATPVFNAAAKGSTLTFFEAWCGALAYTFQLYFDFSGYSDMAIGLARMFGIRLPVNFDSPYKALNIIDFWRRWHITLSRFLKDYLYIAMGGNRRGWVRRYINLISTMLLGGLWHGAAWTFVIWGGLHGLYLMINHAWHILRRTMGHELKRSTWWGRGLSRVLTFLAVVVGWVFFRADSLDAAMAMIEGMAGFNGFVLPASSFEKFGWSLRLVLTDLGWEFNDTVKELFKGTVEMAWLTGLLVLAWWLPNTQQFMSRVKPALDAHVLDADFGKSCVRWKPTLIWALIMALIAISGVLSLSEISEFLYFQF